MQRIVSVANGSGMGGSTIHPAPQGPDGWAYFLFGFFGFGFSGAEGKAA